MAAQPSEVEKDTGESLEQRLIGIIGKLESEAEDRVGKRLQIEQRWIDDVTQYHGKYTAEILADLKNAGKSQAYLNQTRPKTNAMEARLSDMLFPTDDRNWGIQPTPVPELTIGAEQSARNNADAKIKLAANPNDPNLQAAAQQAESVQQKIQAQLEEARKRCRAMEEEIDDHLRECDYAASARDVIRDACKLGTGVMKGPFGDGKARRSWQQPMVAGPDGKETRSTEYSMVLEADQRPAYWRVDPWNFFPDMDACSMDDCESVYERHLLNKKQLRRLAQQPGFDKAAIRRLLSQNTQEGLPQYVSQLRSITSDYSSLSGDRYHVWEYHGPLTSEDMMLLGVATKKTDLLEDVGLLKGGEPAEEIDPLKEIQVVIWFCQGEMLKFGIHHLDSEDSIYSVFNLEKDEASLFGFGIPHIMRDSQSALAAAWRTLLDNMGLSSGPQIVINDDTIVPVDGKWQLLARKIWTRKANAIPDKKPFETYDIPSHITELLELVEVTKKNIDEETALPMLAQGDQSSQITKTAGGMSLLMNSVNIVFRRIVKNWDDDITDPNITRMYDWLMQFSKKDYIKGDYDVDARGTSVLLVREMQAANLMLFLMNFGAHPILGKYLKEEGLPALRRLAQVLMIPADEIVKSDEEVATDQAEAANEKPPPDPKMLAIEMQGNNVRLKADLDLKLAYVHRDTEMMKLAQQGNFTLDELKAMLADHSAERDHKERMMFTEAAVESREKEKDRQAGADDQKPKGSGGYFS